MKMLGVKSSWVCAAVRCTFTAVEAEDQTESAAKSVIAICAAGPRSAAKSISTGAICSATVARTASARSALGICPVSKTSVTNSPQRCWMMWYSAGEADKLHPRHRRLRRGLIASDPA